MLVDDKGLRDLSAFASLKVSQYEVKFELPGGTYVLDTDQYLSSDAIALAIRANTDGVIYNRYDFLEAIGLARALSPAPLAALSLPAYWAAIAREALPEDLGTILPASCSYSHSRGFMLVRNSIAWNFYKEPLSMGVQALTSCCRVSLVPQSWDGPGYRPGSCFSCGRHVWTGSPVETADLHRERPRLEWLESVLIEVHGLDPLTASIEAGLLSDQASKIGQALLSIHRNQLSPKR